MRQPATVSLQLAALALSLSACAYHPRPVRPVARPVLFVHVTVDQMRADYLERFGPELTGGFGRLLREGAVFQDAYQDHALSLDAPGYAAVSTGRYPYSSGIRFDTAAVGDTTAPLVSYLADSTGVLVPGVVRGSGASPRRLRGGTLVDWVRERWPRARALSVSATDYGAILPVGVARTNAWVYWYAGERFTTSTYYADTLPGWVRAFNDGLAPARAPNLAWDPLLPLERYAEPDSVPFEAGGGDFQFPHPIADDTLQAAAGLVDMPWMDSLTLALALEGMRQLRLGRGAAGPDIVAIGLSTLDRTGHRYGPNSVELHDHVLRLDGWLGGFFAELERLTDRTRIVVSLTSNHGVTPLPEWTVFHGDSTVGYVNVDSVIAMVRGEIAERLGPGPWIPARERGLVRLNRAAVEAAGINNVDSVADRLAELLRSLPGVAQVDTRRTLAAADTATDPIARRWLRALPPAEPADVMITLVAPNYFAPPPRFAQHGQATADDTRVPLLLMGPGVRRGNYAARVAAVDLAPTLAALAGVPTFPGLDGRVLREALR